MIYEEARSELNSLLLNYQEINFERIQELFVFIYDSMDWYYEYSDDHSVWSKYNNRKKELEHFHSWIYTLANKSYNHKQKKFI